MKLLYCITCEDVFKLDKDLRSCRCGIVKGRYIDNITAETNGKGISLAIGNGSLQNAITDMLAQIGNGNRESFLEVGKGRISHAWVRPNQGEGNPHTVINRNL